LSGDGDGGGNGGRGRFFRQVFAHDSIYRKIRAERVAAGKAEKPSNEAVHDQAEEEAARENERLRMLRNDPAPWTPILELAPEFIAEQSKDLEVVATWIEALVRSDGFAGLRDGFRLARLLAEKFWDHLYPLPDEDGIRTRVAQLTSLNGEGRDGVLIQPIRKIFITQGRTVGPYSLLEYEIACSSENGYSQYGVTKEKFDAAVKETSPQWFQNLLDDISQCSEEFSSLCEVLEEKCGRDKSGFSLAPPSSNISNVIDEYQRTVKIVCKPVLNSADAGQPPDEPGTQIQAMPASATQAPAIPGSVQSRQDALRVLQAAADFFRQTEPHSPISYAFEQAVRWGKMPLPDLLTELIPDRAAREQLFKLVGIKLPEDKHDNG